MIREGVGWVLAPNPGPMTGNGTNSYLIGCGEVAVVDPGPAIESHIELLLEAAESRGRLRYALITHWHPDHLPAALALRRRHGVRVFGHPTLPNIDHALSGGDRIELGGLQILVVATPGHTRDHLCYFVEGCGALFS